MSIYLEVMCNYDCGNMLHVELGDRPRSVNGRTPKWEIHEWLGKGVLDALRAHHTECAEYAKARRRVRLSVVRP